MTRGSWRRMEKIIIGAKETKEFRGQRGSWIIYLGFEVDNHNGRKSIDE